MTTEIKLRGAIDGSTSFSILQTGEGDSLETRITARDGQFSETTFTQTADGFDLTIFGTWEINDLITALMKLREKNENIKM
jgi:hypothetical protein